MSTCTILVGPPGDLRKTFYLTYTSYRRPSVFFKGNDTGRFNYILHMRIKTSQITWANKALLLVKYIVSQVRWQRITQR